MVMQKTNREINMRKLFWFLVGFILVFSVGIAQAEDVTLAWDASKGATGYKLYKSVDLGITWTEPIDVGLVTEYTYKDVEETGLILFRASAYNAQGEAIAYDAGAWYNFLWRLPESAGGLGVK